MTRFSRTLAVAAVAVTAIVARPAAQTASIQSDFLKDWQGQKDMLVKIAQAMPEDKYSFKATPAERSFGEHVMHIAQINVLFLQMLKANAPAPQINMKATSKADTIKAMSDSFDYGLAILKEQTDQTMVGGVQGPPFMGFSTRARMFEFLVGHTQDTYGQMVVYLRLSGLVPPASQRP
ncbi:MAG TPA: DinB family protein [Vicinamibacterales bacterium]|nr:DinB family protein [Vicinamibacterales bacterium]